MGFLILLLFLAVVAIYFLFMFIQSYNNRNIVIQWLLFLPTSLVFTVLIGLIFGVIFIGFIPLKEIVFLPLSWTICPVVFFVLLNKTMPRGKRIATNILAVMYMLLGIFDLFRLVTSKLFPETFEPYEISSPWIVLLVSRFIQIIILSYFFYIYNKKYKNEILISEEKT